MELKRENSYGMSDMEAHALAMSLPIGRVVRSLVDVLGATTVSVIGGVSETRAVSQWTDGRIPQRSHVLRFAFQVLSMVSIDGNDDVARAWFYGSNPHLNDQVPVLLLRDRPLGEIAAAMMSAARAFAAR
jgi:hypothetical protein